MYTSCISPPHTYMNTSTTLPNPCGKLQKPVAHQVLVMRLFDVGSERCPGISYDFPSPARWVPQSLAVTGGRRRESHGAGSGRSQKTFGAPRCEQFSVAKRPVVGWPQVPGTKHRHSEPKIRTEIIQWLCLAVALSLSLVV